MTLKSISDLKSRILPLRKQAEITDAWLKYRLEHLMPKLMAQAKIEMWIVIGGEYNEDPTILSLTPAVMLSARRCTILVFCLQEDGSCECLSFGKKDPALDQYYKPSWDKDKGSQWAALAAKIKEVNPQSIGLNISETFNLGDGLSKGNYDKLMNVLDKDQQAKIKSADELAISWLETRTSEEIEAYEGIVDIAHKIIAKAFSRDVVHVGITTANDLAWWMRQSINEIGLNAWFQPTIAIQRLGEKHVLADEVIRQGDILHCDMGFHYFNLATDTQQMAYVLQPGEKEAPFELKEALKDGNRLQDLFTNEFAAGRTGNDIFLSAIAQAKKEGIKAMIYTHPIGVHGHGGGPTMGLFDQQEYVKGAGEYLLNENTCYAIELNIKKELSSWDKQEVMIALEQTAVFTKGEVYYLGGRQKEWHLV